MFLHFNITQTPKVIEFKILTRGVKMKRMNLGNTKMRCKITFFDEIDIKIIRKPPILLPTTLFDV